MIPTTVTSTPSQGKHPHGDQAGASCNEIAIVTSVQEPAHNSRENQDEETLGAADGAESKQILARHEVLHVVGRKGTEGVDQAPGVEHQEKAADEANPRPESARPLGEAVEIDIIGCRNGKAGARGGTGLSTKGAGNGATKRLGLYIRRLAGFHPLNGRRRERRKV